ncbi:arylsulfatase A, partial [Alcaligenes faecalis subsp. faecalis NCIB 8687]
MDTPCMIIFIKTTRCSVRRSSLTATPICMPNRASLMTGRMPSLHGARHNGVPLPLEWTQELEKLQGHA